MSKIVIPLGDIHVGNDGSVQTEEVWSEETIEARAKLVSAANPTQMKLLRKWEEMCDDYPRPDVLILNGDLIDGKNYKESGKGVWTTDVDLQASVCAELISWLKPRKIIGTSGSPYHCESNPNMDRKAIIKAAMLSLGITEDEAKTCFRSGYTSTNIDGCRIHAMHLISTSRATWQYRTTPVARSLVLSALNESEFGHYDVVLKSHAHYFTFAGYSTSVGMILPCWKAYDPFGDTRIEFANPACGYVAFEVQQDGSYTWDADIMHFKQADLNPDVIV